MNNMTVAELLRQTPAREIVFYKSYAEAEANLQPGQYVEMMGNANRRWYCRDKSFRGREALPQGRLFSIPAASGAFPGI